MAWVNLLMDHNYGGRGAVAARKRNVNASAWWGNEVDEMVKHNAVHCAPPCEGSAKFSGTTSVAPTAVPGEGQRIPFG